MKRFFLILLAVAVIGALILGGCAKKTTSTTTTTTRNDTDYNYIYHDNNSTQGIEDWQCNWIGYPYGDRRKEMV